jgi:hypothetical protein
LADKSEVKVAIKSYEETVIDENIDRLRKMRNARDTAMQ